MKMKILANAAARLKGNPFKGNQIEIWPDFAKKIQDKRKALLPFKKHLQEKLGQDSKVFISYTQLAELIGLHLVVAKILRLGGN